MSRLSRFLLVTAAAGSLAGSLAACDTAADAEAAGPGAATAAGVRAERAMDADALDATLLSDDPLEAALASAGEAFRGRHRGAVFTLSDAAGPNEVVAFARAADGTLTPAGATATGGTGSGGMLGAATDPLVLSPDGRFLYAINRGSSSITAFRVRGTELDVIETEPSGSTRLMSLALHGRLLWALHEGAPGGPAMLVAFSLSPSGALSPLPNGAVALPASVGGPPQVRFAPDGRTAVVTDRPSNQILVFPVGRDGRPGTPTVTASAGVTPFGFDFDRRGRLVVSDANAPAGPVANGSTVSTYGLNGTQLAVLDAAVPTTETAACWVRILGRYAYVTNTGSGTVTGFEIQRDGTLEILDADGVTATTGANPRDLNIALRYAYVQTDGRLDAFRIRRDGSLTPVGTVAVPATARGVATL